MKKDEDNENKFAKCLGNVCFYSYKWVKVNISPNPKKQRFRMG